MLERTIGNAGARGRLIRWAVAVLLLTALIATLEPSAAAAQKKRGWTRRRTIAPGVVFKKIKDPKGPWRIFILSVRPDVSATLDSVLATDRLLGLEQTSSMASRSGAIAAFNGDYGAGVGRPVHTFARDGFLDQSETMWGRNFSMAASKTEAFFGHPQLRATIRDTFSGI